MVGAAEKGGRGGVEWNLKTIYMKWNYCMGGSKM